MIKTQSFKQSRQHPWPHVMGNIILFSVTFFEIWDHCQNLLDDPHKNLVKTTGQLEIN